MMMCFFSIEKIKCSGYATAMLYPRYTDATIVSMTDFYPFGMVMPGRMFKLEGSSYRYGFNGKENDSEVKGIEGSQQDYGFRVYDPRLGKFLSVDPLSEKYPYYTPYQFAGNTPIQAADLDGLEEWMKQTELAMKRQAQLKIDGAQPNDRERQLIEAQARSNNNQSSVSATPKLYMNFQIREHQAATEAKFVQAGYNKDGTKPAWRKLAENKTFSNFANNIALPMVEMAAGDGLGRLLSFGSKGMATLGESGINVVDVVMNQGLKPGSRGVYLGAKRLSEIEMRAMSDLHKIEFAQVYTMGSGRNGGGGYYTLYSGTADRITLPVGRKEILINHTHPGGTLMPSSYDVKYLRRATSEGSPQKSSSIIPNGGSTFRFNGNTRVSDPQNLKIP